MTKPTDTHKLGLIGYPLGHSFSPPYFQKKFEALGFTKSEYVAYAIKNIDEIEKIFQKGVTGLNVTIPYKEQIIPYLDQLSDEALQINAVNTIKIEGGKRVGYNTDVYGFEHSLLDFIGDAPIEKALILGTGGAAKAVKFVLEKTGIAYSEVSRKKGYLNYEDIDHTIIEKHHLIINTTPLGMHPKIDQCPPIPYSALTEKHFLFDLIYNPEKTLFLKKGEVENCSIRNGMEMLILQAEKAWEIWNQL